MYLIMQQKIMQVYTLTADEATSRQQNEISKGHV